MDNPSRSCTAGNSHPHEAGLGFGSVPKAGRSEQQAEKKNKCKFLLEVLVQAGAHKSSTTKERLGVLLQCKVCHKSAGCPLYIAPSLVVTEKLKTCALRKATLKYIPSGVSRVQLFKQLNTFSYQLQHFCLLRPSPNCKTTTDPRQCCYFSSVFLYLLLYLSVTKAQRWELLENLRQFHKTNTLRAIPAHSDLHPNTRRGFSFKKGQILAKKTLSDTSLSF